MKENFVKLTLSNGEIVFVNAYNVTHIQSEGDLTAIYLVANKIPIRVKDSISSVFQKIASNV